MALIWLDPRVGSGELLRYFKPFDVDVEVTPLEFGDIAFAGEGDGEPVMVGIERKTIGFYMTDDGKGRMGQDFVASMRSNRLSGFQLKGLLEHYTFVIFLLEGIWRCGEHGEIVVPVRRQWVPLRGQDRPVLYREVVGHLMTLKFVCGCEVQRTAGPAESAAWLVALYKWFQKPWDKHESHLGIYAPGPEVQRHRRRGFAMPEIGPVEVVAAQFPGVDRKAYAFGKRFTSVAEMIEANEATLGEVEGIGKKGAAKIHRWLRNGKE